MSVTTAEAQRFEDTATEDELAAYVAAYDAAQEPCASAEQYRDLFLILAHPHPRRVPVVALIGVDHGARVLDGVWIYLPGRRHAMFVNRGPVFDRTAAAVRGELVADLAEVA